MEQIKLGVARRQPSDDLAALRWWRHQQERKRIEAQAGGAVSYDIIMIARRVADAMASGREVRERDWRVLPLELQVFLQGCSESGLKAAAIAARRRPGISVGEWYRKGAAVLG